ncbi:sarcosine oxidase subunit gamma [Ruegeria halocynthiae]|uniref:sarcosine oxidase subunit gamma n=1 Tax=Ruegeria halocynthiae TaxID=985054 RepID=UPI00055F5108|nr:sarcosine oxidase subunit gamma [Ruegeria halocynthiae]
MHDLVAITALGGTEPRMDTVAGVTCSEVPDVALASVAARMGQENNVIKALEALIETPVPDVGQSAGAVICAFWAGPDQWMIEAPQDSHEGIATQVKSAVGNAASVTEQTDGWTRFDLSGPNLTAVLELLSSLDLRKATTGSVTRSSIHHIGCFVLFRTPELFSIYGPRSSAGSLHHAILTAMRSAL